MKPKKDTYEQEPLMGAEDEAALDRAWDEAPIGVANKLPPKKTPTPLNMDEVKKDGTGKP